ncbi:MAG: spermidine/putrescine ABC transporter substrate-binding protein [Chloroflexota bacterium]
MSDEQRSRIEMAILQAMRHDRISRRAFLGRAGRGGIALGAALSLPALIAACTPSSDGVTLEWANWCCYIDIDEEIAPDPTPYPTLNAFIAQTGNSVNYQEAITDNAEFMQTLLPDLTNNISTGWDLITPGGWVVDRLGALGFLEEIDHSKLPNWSENAADYAVGQWFDPDNKYSLWWQGGITGVGYDPNLTGRELTTFEDLFDPEFAGRVGAFKDMREMLGLTLLSLGVVPENATIDDAQAAVQKLLDANERDQFRGYYGNEYYDALSAGDLVACVAWSGDVNQIALYDNPDVQFYVPAEGGVRWNDNLCIPKGSTTKMDQTLQLMDYYYGLDAATAVSEYVGYRTGVAGVRERIDADAQAARDAGDEETAGQLEATAATVAPSADQIDNTYPYKQLTEEEDAEWSDLWEAVRR